MHCGAESQNDPQTSPDIRGRYRAFKICLVRDTICAKNGSNDAARLGTSLSPPADPAKISNNA